MEMYCLTQVMNNSGLSMQFVVAICKHAIHITVTNKPDTYLWLNQPVNIWEANSWLMDSKQVPANFYWCDVEVFKNDV